MTPAADLLATRERLRTGQTSPRAEIERAIAAAVSPACRHAFLQTDFEGARAQAAAADPTRQPLAGLAVSVKDLFDVTGQVSRAGSLVLGDAPPARQDAVAVARLRAAGGAVLGRTHMTEFAYSGVGVNPHHETPANATATDMPRVPGGSSSGAAVSVAAGAAFVGLGSDTGGSIRIPAALCGIVGFKSTQSRVPRTGAFELARSLDTVCAMARSVEDCLVADAAIADAPLAVRRRPAQGLRLAVPKTLMFDAIEPGVARAFERAVQALSKAGAQIVEIPLSELAEIGTVNAPGGLSPIEASAVHRERFASKREAFDSRVAARIALGTEVRAADYIALLDRRREWISRVEGRLEGFDALLCPTVPIVAPAIDSLAEDSAFFQANGLLLRNTFAINLMDGCSFSLPCHSSGELPVGLMLSSVRGDDSRLAGVALAVEDVLRVG